MNFSIFIFVFLFIASCGVKSPPQAIGEKLPSVDSIYMDKVTEKENKKLKSKEQKP